MRNLIKVMKLILRPKNLFHLEMEISFGKSNTPHRHACKKKCWFCSKIELATTMIENISTEKLKNIFIQIYIYRDEPVTSLYLPSLLI